MNAIQQLQAVRDALKAQPKRTMNEYKVIGKLTACIELLEADAKAAKSEAGDQKPETN
jgi:hypothetical protein